MLYIEHPKHALVRAINAGSGLNPPLAVDDVTFGLPEVWLEGDTNSRVQLTAAGANYTGSDYHKYTRVRIYEHFAGHVLPGRASDYRTVREAVAAFYRRYQLPYDADDILDYDLPAGATTATLQGRVNSLMFIPNLSIALPFER